MHTDPLDSSPSPFQGFGRPVLKNVLPFDADNEAVGDTLRILVKNGDEQDRIRTDSAYETCFQVQSADEPLVGIARSQPM